MSQWADRYRILDSKSSGEPGPWRTGRVPYMKGIMDAVTDPQVEEIVFVKPSQVGGTEGILNILGYIVHQDPSPTQVVYPSQELAESISKNRLQPMIGACRELQERYYSKESKLLELQFKGMYLNLTGANSATELSSKSIRFLLLDEVDKYPPRAGKETNPIALARERTKNFPFNKKIFITSTPTLKTGAIWREYTSCTSRYSYQVPCPHCGQFQTLKRKQIWYDHEAGTKEEKKKSAFYACEYCGCQIFDGDKNEMLQRGKWTAEQEGQSRKKVGYRLNALYSPWLTFGDVVFAWAEAQDDPEKLMNFINSWLAEPWEQVGTTAGEERVLDKQSRYQRSVVPSEAVFLTAGADVQHNGLYYTVRAWGWNKKSWNIDHDFVADFDELLRRLNQPYLDEHGEPFQIRLALIDSGDQTGRVYDFCYVNQPLTIPVKGSSHPIVSGKRITTIDKEDSIARGSSLVLCDGGFYKDSIFRQINQTKDLQWFVYQGCDREYAGQVTSEHKVFETVNGRQVWRWIPKKNGAANHYLDCEVYAACAADLMGARALLEEPKELEKKIRQTEYPEEQENDFIGGENWLDGGDWL